MKRPYLYATIFIAILTFCSIGQNTPDTVKEIADINYASYGERKVPLDLYVPKKDDSKLRSGIILIHGGGWIGGSRKAFRQTAIRLAHEGYVVANIDYRLATEAEFPGCVSDAKAAVRWLKAHAKEHRVDPEKIFAIGGSAGGHLAAMVATSPGKFEGEGGWDEQSSAVAGVIVMGTGVDQVKRVKDSKSGSVKNCVIFFGGELSEKPKLYAAGSPITHVSANMPPILFLDGGRDNPGKRYVEMREKLDKLRVRHDLVVVPEAKHGQWGKEPWKSQFEDAMLDFLRKIDR